VQGFATKSHHNVSLCRVSSARELQEAYNAKIEDEDALANLQAELTMTAASRDAALQREDLAKELISQLQDEVSRLRSQVRRLHCRIRLLCVGCREVAPVRSVIWKEL
jgi:chromosome segregation ATPase